MASGLASEELDLAFPFHLSIGIDGRLRRLGPELEALIPAAKPGALWTEHFQGEHAGRPLENVAELRLPLASAVIITAIGRPLKLRASVLRREDHLLFLATPRIGRAHELIEAGTTVAALPLHDPSPEFLAALALQDHAMQKARELTRRLRDQRKALKEAKLIAERAARAKSDFLANMSHEIRTPLNGVLGITDALMQTELDDNQQQLLHTIHSSGSTLLVLLNDILDWSKLETGKLEIDPEPTDVREVFDNMIRLMSHRASKKRISLTSSLAPEGPLWLKLDEHRLSQVVSNLLGNAVKFTETGSVTLTGVWAEGWLNIEVTDTGIGIDPSIQEMLFDRFSQADKSTTREFGGTGLGLAIARQLTELMGGTLTVKSQLGEGSTFTLQIPASTSEQRASSQLETQDLPMLHVLVVDDNAVNLKVAALMVKSMGHRVTMAKSGADALEEARAHNFDLVLMDYHMPHMDGLEATRRLHEQDSTGKLTVVGLTAAAFPDDRQACLEAGMADVLVKPVRRDALQRILSGVAYRA